jgi:hypothetical protein
MPPAPQPLGAGTLAPTDSPPPPFCSRTHLVTLCIAPAIRIDLDELLDKLAGEARALFNVAAANQTITDNFLEVIDAGTVALVAVERPLVNVSLDRFIPVVEQLGGALFNASMPLADLQQFLVSVLLAWQQEAAVASSTAAVNQAGRAVRGELPTPSSLTPPHPHTPPPPPRPPCRRDTCS